MKNYKIIDNYTNALFDSLENDKEKQQVLLELESIYDIFKENGDLYNILILPIISQKIKSSLLQKLFKYLKYSEICFKFCNLLIKNDRIEYFRDIITQYKILIAQEKNIKTVQITFAQKLDKDDKNHIKEFLQQTLGKIEVEYGQDERLIGGFVVRYESIEMDYSLKGALGSMRIL